LLITFAFVGVASRPSGTGGEVGNVLQDVKSKQRFIVAFCILFTGFVSLGE